MLKKQKKLREESRLDALENYIINSLDDEARLKLKMKSPLGVANNVLAKTEERIRFQIEDLKRRCYHLECTGKYDQCLSK